MRRDQKEIRQVLERGQEILTARPELLTYDVETIIDELDDGTDEMIHNRWGAAAQVIVRSITDFRVVELVSHLAKVHLTAKCSLAFEYAGYLLQQDYGVVLESLLIEAHRQGCVKQILDYVSPNLLYITSVSQEWILPLLEILEQYPDKRGQLLWNYADGIVACYDCSDTMEILGELQSETQAELAFQLLRRWNSQDPISAADSLCCLSNHKSFWSKQAYLESMNRFLFHGQGFFTEQFPKMENMFEEDPVLWRKGIPVLAHALLENVVEDAIHSQVIRCLGKVLTGTSEEKRAFLSALCWQNALCNDIKVLLETLLERPFEEGKCPLDLLNHVLHSYGEQYGWKEMLKQMRKVFRANGYRWNHSAFFHDISYAQEVLIKDIQMVVLQAMEDLLSNDVDQVFFGVGVMTELVPGNQLVVPTGNLKPLYTDLQLAKILRLLLYLSVDEKKVCNGVFQLLTLINEAPKYYISACWDDVYENYPNTFYNAALLYCESDNEVQKNLAQQIVATYEATQEEQKKAYAVRDFHPSEEHWRIYAHAQHRHNDILTHRSEDKSLFSDMFPRRIIKYGTSSAHIIRGRKGEQYFQSAPYQTIKVTKERSRLYSNDPVEFVSRRIRLLQEVNDDETDFEGLSVAVEREG